MESRTSARRSLWFAIVSGALLAAAGVAGYAYLSRSELVIRWPMELRTEGSRLFIDGQSQAMRQGNAMRFVVGPGAHTVTMERPGFRTIRQTVSVSRRSDVEFSPRWRPGPENQQWQTLHSLHGRWLGLTTEPSNHPDVRALRRDVDRLMWSKLNVKSRAAAANLRWHLPTEFTPRLIERLDTPTSLASDDAAPREWRLGSDRMRHAGKVTQVHFSPHHKLLYSTSVDGWLRQWNLVSGQPIASVYGGRGGIAAMDVARRGDTIITGTHDGVVQIWDRTLGSSRDLELDYGTVKALRLSHRGDLFAVGDNANRIRVWDTESLMPVKHVKMTHWVRCVDWFDKDRLLVIGDANGLVRVWDRNADSLREFRKGPPPQRFTYDATNQLLTCLGANRIQATWDLNASDPLPTNTRAIPHILDVAHDNDWWLTKSSNLLGKSLSILDSEQTVHHQISLNAVASLSDDSVTAGSYAPRFQQVAIGSEQGDLMVFSTEDPQPVFDPGPPADQFHCVAISGDGSMIATGANDGSVAIWDAFERKRLSVWKPHAQPVNFVEFCDRDRTIVSQAGSLLVTTQVDDPKSMSSQPGRPPIAVAKHENSMVFRRDDALVWQSLDRTSDPVTLPLAATDRTQIALYPTGDFLAVAEPNQRVQIFDRQNVLLQSMSPLPDSSQMSWLDHDRLFAVWPSGCEIIHPWSPLESGTDEPTQWTAMPRLIPRGSDRPIVVVGGQVYQWDPTDKTLDQKHSFAAETATIHDAAFAPDGRTIAIVDGSGQILFRQ